MRGPLAFRFACAPMPPAASLAVPDDHRGILRLDDAHNIEQLLLARLLDGNDAQPFALTASGNIDSKFAHVGDEVGPVFVYVDTLDFGICSGNDTPAADEAIVVKKEAVVEHMLSVQIRVDEQRQDAILTARLKAGLRSPQLRIFTPCAERKNAAHDGNHNHDERHRAAPRSATQYLHERSKKHRYKKRREQQVHHQVAIPDA